MSFPMKCVRCGARAPNVQHAERLAAVCPFKDDGCILEHELEKLPPPVVSDAPA